jgi:hypothetical protein
MSDITFKVGDAVTIVDLNKQGVIDTVSEDGTQFGVKYTDDAGAEQVETVTADKLVPVTTESSEDKSSDASEDGEEKAA